MQDNRPQQKSTNKRSSAQGNCKCEVPIWFALVVLSQANTFSHQKPIQGVCNGTKVDILPVMPYP